MSLSTITQPITFRNLRFLCSAILLAGLPFSLLVAAPTLDANLTDPVAKGSVADVAFANTFWPFAADAKPLSCPTSITIGFAPAVYCTNTQGVLNVNAVGGTFPSPSYQWSASNGRVTLSNTTSATPDIDYITSGTTTISVTVTDGTCGTFTASQLITISTTPEPTITTSTTEVCQNNTITSITGSPSGSTRQWTVNNFSEGNPFGTFSAPTNQSTNFTANHAGNAEIFYEVTTTAGCTGTSEAQPITIFSPVVATAAIQSSNQPNVCADATLSLAASATGGNSSYSYAWEYMGGTQLVPTFVNASILLNNVNAQNPVLTPVGTASDGDTYIFRVKATDGILCEDFSDNITITVRSITSASLSITGASTICEDGTTTFKVDVTRGNTGGSPTYTLVYNDGTADITVNDYVSGSSITTNAQSADCSLAIVSIKDTRVTVSNCNSPSNGSAATVTVNNLSAGSISGEVTICSGDDPAEFGSNAATGDGTITYLWESSTDGTNFTTTGITTETLDPAALTADTWYRRVATSTQNAVPCSKTSNTLKVTVNNLTAGTVGADQTICSGDDAAAFTVATAATGDGALSYQWQISTDGGAMWNDINAATDATYDEGTLTADAQYRRITTSTLDMVACTATSNVITVTVNNVTAGEVAGDQTICSTDDAAAFTEVIPSTGDGTLSYQWQISTDGGAMWNDINAATAATYDEGALTADAQYRRITTSTFSSVACTATSNVITVMVNNITAGSIAGDQTICSGQTASFTQTTAATADGAISYEWESSIDNGANWSNIPLATSATYTTGALTQSTQFRRKDISSLNSVACNAYTNVLTVTVQTATGGVLYVNDATGNDANLGTENCPKKTIQAAVTAAVAGDVVMVAAGTYAENVTINKDLDIRGANYNVACDSRLSESVIAPSSGLPVSITTDGVTLNGFEITAPSYQYAILCGNTSNLMISYNNIHHINSSATPALTPTHAIQYTVPNAPAAKSNVSVTDNCINNIGSVNLTGNSATAMGFLQSTTTGTLTGLTISRNTISDVTVSNAVWPTGKIAYGIQLNAGSANFKTTTGKIVDATITDNVISVISGHIATGIALEGNTEDAVVTGNAVSVLTSTKNGDRAAGGVDLNGLKFETNRFVSTCTVENNSFETTTFNSALGNGVGYGVANYVPTADGDTAVVTCNWFGTTSASVIADNAGLTGKILNKANCSTTFQPSYLVSGLDNNPAIGFQPALGTCTGTAVTITAATLDQIWCGDATGSIAVTFSGGTGPYDIAWTGGSATGVTSPYTIPDLAAGTYGITVTDANGSTDSDDDLIIENLPVHNSTADTRHATIQAAINAALAGHVIEVCAGTYVENVTVNKALDVRGPNWNVSPNGGSRVAEAVIVPASTNTSTGAIVTINSGDVSFKGFTLEGDNTDLPNSGVGLGGALGTSIDAARGIFLQANGITGVTIAKNIAKNAVNGIRLEQTTNYFATTPGALRSYNILVDDNKVQDMTSTGIRLGNSMYAKVTNNTVTNVSTGIGFSSFRISDAGNAADRVISNNTITSRFAGLWVNLFSASPYALNNNTISVAPNAPEEAPTPLNRTAWFGIMYSTVSAAQNFTNQVSLPKVTTPEYWTATGNMIDGSELEGSSTGYGYWLYHVDNNRDDASVDHFGQISGGTVSGVDVGMMLKNRDTDPATNFGTAAVGAHASVSDVDFSLRSGGTGLRLVDDASWTTSNPAPLINKRDVKLTIGNDVTFAGGATGIKIEHPIAGTSNYNAYSSITSGDLSNTTLSSQSGNYLELSNHPNALDATMVSFDGQTGATATLAENFDIEDKISHKVDDATRGLVRVKAAEVFVTANSGSVQRGVDAASANDVVNVEAGTYTETVTINKSLDIRGANYGIDPNTDIRVAESILNGTLLVQSSTIGIDGFAITGSSFAVQAPGTGQSAITIRNNHMYANTGGRTIEYWGTAQDATDWTVSNNLIEDIQATDATAITLFDITGLTITDNVIEHTNSGFNGRRGLNLDGCRDVTFSGNSVNMGLVNPASDNSDGAFTKARYSLQLSASNRSVTNVIVDNNTLVGGYDGVITLGNGVFDLIDITNNEMNNNVLGIRFQAGTNVPTGSQSNITIENNTISTSNRGIYLVDGTASGGSADPYTNVSITNNSLIRSTAGFTLEVHAGAILPDGPISATCNWYGTLNANTIASEISGNVTYSPWLVDGTDNDGVTLGFQPVPGSCTGTPVEISSATQTADAICDAGAEITVTFSGGTGPYNITWTGGSATGVSSPYIITGLASGTYTTTVTDANGSTAESAVVVITNYTVVNVNTNVGYVTIQAAINAANAGDVIEICAGTFTENVSISKRVTIDGAGSGSDPLSNTVITAAAGGTSTIVYTAGGTDVSNRQVLKDIRVTGASGGTGNNNSGILISGGSMGYFTFDNVAATGNSGHGLVSNVAPATSTLTDVVITGSSFSGNGSAGIRTASHSVDGFSVTNSTMQNNTGLGLAFNPSDNTTAQIGNVTLNGVTFSGNNSVADLYAFRMLGNMSLTNVDFQGSAGSGLFGLYLLGGYVNQASAPAIGTVTLNDVSVAGTYTSAGISFLGYSDLAGVSMTDVVLNTSIPTANRGHLRLSGVAGTLNLGNTAFVTPVTNPPVLDILLNSNFGAAGSISTVQVDATNATFDASLGSAMTLSQLFTTEDRIRHAIDGATDATGFVRVKAGEVFVTPNSFASPATAPSVQRGVDAATAGDILQIQDGTYTAQAVTVNKRLDINGQGDGTIIQNTGNTVFTYTAAGSGTDAVDRAYLRNVKVSGSSRGLLAGQVVNHLTLDDVTFDGNTSYAIHVNNTSGVMNDWEITNCTFNANSAGLYVATAANIDGVSVTGSTFTNQTNTAFYAGQSSSTPGGFSNVTITGNTFTDNGPSNNQAAFYLEKLTDAVISENTMTNNGLSTNPRGIIANLKYGTYSNVSITDNTIVETRGAVQTNGYGINVQGRNDAPTYNSNPGTLEDVTVSGNEISGLYRGIEIDNDVNWNFTAIQNNTISGAEYGILGVVYGTGNTANATTTMNVHENSILANTFVVGNFNTNGGTIDAECNWYGTVNGSTIAAKMSGTVDYSPWLVDGTDDDLLTIGFQPVSGACSATAVEVTLNMQTNITGCFGDATGAIDITVTGGVPPYTYAWSNDATTADLTGLTAGTYTVTVTDGIETTGTLSVTLTQPDAVTPIGTPSHVSCRGGNNGSIELTVTGGTGSYNFDWNGLPAGDGSSWITDLEAGTYTVTVTDNNGCTGTTSVTVNEPASDVSADISGSTNVSCNGGTNGTATVAPAGGTPGYTYSWSTTPAQTGATATGLAAGTYTVTVFDGNNCQATTSVTLTEPSALSASITAQTNVSCNGGYDGSATVTAMGGTMPYEYDWAIAFGDMITDLSAAIYTVTVTDDQGCTTTAVATITQPDALTLATTQMNVTCNGDTDGTATVTPDGGTTPYTYTWSNGQTDAVAIDLIAGTYTVTVTDANDCAGTTSVTITQPAVLAILTSPTSATATVACGATAAVDAEFVAWNTGVTYTGGAPLTDVTENYTVTADVNGSLVETYNGVDPTAPPADGGFTVVTWTVTDGCGNTATVSATFTVNNCMRISGALKYYRDDAGVGGVNVDMVGTGANDGISAGDGSYTVYSNTTGNFDVIPASIRVCEPCTTGTTVSTADLKDIYNISVEDVDAIKAHIAAGAQFEDIYQRAAANVVLGTSGSQTNNRLTSADATALSQAINGSLTQQVRLSRRAVPHDEDLIAGAPDPLPRSWGLVPVVNAGNLAPAQYGDFTQKRNYPTLDGAFTAQDFVVLQVGDVTDHNSLRGEDADARYAGSPLIWKVKDAELTEGEVIDAAFTIEQMQNLRGWQFGLQFDPEYLKVDTLTTTDALPLDPEVNFGLYQAEMGEIRSLWTDGVTKSLNKGESVFSLRFTVLQGGKNLSEVLKLEESSATYALTDQRDHVAVLLAFDAQVQPNQSPVLYQNTPNPFNMETSVRFELPEASDIQLTIHDVNGRMIQELNGYYSKGLHEVRFGRGEMGQYSGVLYYTLRSGDFIATRKMVIID